MFPTWLGANFHQYQDHHIGVDLNIGVATDLDVVSYYNSLCDYNCRNEQKRKAKNEWKWQRSWSSTNLDYCHFCYLNLQWNANCQLTFSTSFLSWKMSSPIFFSKKKILVPFFISYSLYRVMKITLFYCMCHTPINTPESIDPTKFWLWKCRNKIFFASQIIFSKISLCPFFFLERYLFAP